MSIGIPERDGRSRDRKRESSGPYGVDIGQQRCQRRRQVHKAVLQVHQGDLGSRRLRVLARRHCVFLPRRRVCLCMCSRRLRFQGAASKLQWGVQYTMDHSRFHFGFGMCRGKQGCPKGSEPRMRQGRPAIQFPSLPNVTVTAALSCCTQPRPDSACLITPARPATRRAKKRVCMPLETRLPCQRLNPSPMSNQAQPPTSRSQANAASASVFLSQSRPLRPQPPSSHN